MAGRGNLVLWWSKVDFNLRDKLAGLRHVNLEVQISWQGQHFVNLEVQTPWHAQHFVNLEV